MSKTVTLQGPFGPFECTEKQAATTYRKYAGVDDDETDELDPSEVSDGDVVDSPETNHTRAERGTE